MIKHIIFDLDNTIIKYTNDYALYYKKALKNCGYNENDYLKIYNAIDDYNLLLSENDRFYSRETLLLFLNKKLNTNYNMQLIDELINVVGNYWINSLFLSEDTLKYLHSKYKLYVFTNFFENCQAQRLERIGYSKYFSKVFGSDTVGAKPFKSSYHTVLNSIGCKPDECIMVGDNKRDDVFGANNAGISAILFDFDGKRDKKDIFAPNYTIITDLKELEKIL